MSRDGRIPPAHFFCSQRFSMEPECDRDESGRPSSNAPSPGWATSSVDLERSAGGLLRVFIDRLPGPADDPDAGDADHGRRLRAGHAPAAVRARGRGRRLRAARSVVARAGPAAEEAGRLAALRRQRGRADAAGAVRRAARSCAACCSRARRRLARWCSATTARREPGARLHARRSARGAARAGGRFQGASQAATLRAADAGWTGGRKQ